MTDHLCDIPLAEWADGRGISIESAQALCKRLKIRVHRTHGLNSAAWRKLDAYILKITGKMAHERLSPQR